jgi:hypothetical protein
MTTKERLEKYLKIEERFLEHLLNRPNEIYFIVESSDVKNTIRGTSAATIVVSLGILRKIIVELKKEIQTPAQEGK